MTTARRMAERLRGQRGQVAAEYLAVGALVVVLLGALGLRFSGGLGRSVSDAVASILCVFDECAEDGARGETGPGGQRDDLGGARDGGGPGVVVASTPEQRLRELAELPAGDGAVEQLLSSLSASEQVELREAARAARETDEVSAAERVGAVRLALHDEAEALQRTIDAADPEDPRGPQLQQLADRLRGWADSDRRFVHVEVDHDAGTARLAELVHGDLDAADHVAVTIPGTNNDAHTFDDDVAGQARALARHLDTLGEDGTAVVACLCYDPPPSLGQAALSGHADRGGPDLARIVGTLPTGDAEIHAFGHSYGATALGRAVGDSGLELASTVSLGGPGFGSGVRSIDDLPETAGQVWGIRHDKDPIQLAFMHGVNPDRNRFGAYGFSMGDGDLDRSRWLPYQLDAHGLYYADAESLANLALIASGRGDEVSGYREGRP